ncbi:ammonium transporter AmtB-like domain-containing protein [Dipodascopsis uninucleata]
MSQYPDTIFNDTSTGWTEAGGNSRLMDVNAAYAPSVGHQVWVMVAGAMIMPIIPGIGLFYAGATRRKASMSILWQSLAIFGIASFQWFFWGYSLTYADNASPFIGTLKYIGLRNVLAKPMGYIPEILYCFFQLMFCVETLVIMIGGAFERCRLMPSMVFSFCWATVVYCPIACWTWNSNGWLYTLGALDFAGGGPVHIASGVGALAFATVLGKRMRIRGSAQRDKFNTSSMTMAFIGTIFIWFGWFGFNGGSTLNATVRTYYVLFNTNLAAGTGIIGDVVVNYLTHKGKVSVMGCCNGVMVGLVAITPAAGYVPVYFAALIGFLTSIICALFEEYVPSFFGIDEGLDVFRNHAIGGICGAIFTGLFAASWVSELDGSTVASGWVDHNYIQLGYQLAEVCAIVGYTYVVSVILLLVIDRIPGMKFRSSEAEEKDGIDKHYLFDFGEEYDHSIDEEEVIQILKDQGILQLLMSKPAGIVNSNVSTVVELKSD